MGQQRCHQHGDQRGRDNDVGDVCRDADRAARNLAGSTEPIGAALLDQRNLAGIGTMWAAESLFLERINPLTPVADLTDDRLRALIDDMFDTMYDAKGIGLAATQVDVHERLIVIDVSEDRDTPMVLINPELVWASDEIIRGEEGCLSVPGI